MKEFNNLIKEQFTKMCSTGKLFKSTITGREVWELYLDSFTDEEDPIFRDPESTTHNCNYCNHFIRRYGNIIAINEDGSIMTIFDVDAENPYKTATVNIASKLRSAPIANVFFESLSHLRFSDYAKHSPKATDNIFRIGFEKNVKRYTKEEAELYGVVKPNEIRTFHHFHADLPKQFVIFSDTSIESIMAKYRDKKNVFARTMEEIPLDTLNLVKDLINQGSLLDGTAHLRAINTMIKYKQTFNHMYVTNIENIENWYWLITYEMSEVTAKFKNSLIGVLCTELAEGVELNKACLNWNKRVDPANYHKATAPITQRQIKEAEKFVTENGYVESFNRRFATIEDIKVTEIKHINVGDGKIKALSIFDSVKPTASTRHKRSQFDKLEEVSIDKFLSDILPSCTSVEVLLENKHKKNMVTLTTSVDENSKPIFKWNNNYSWTYSGNLAGKSQIAESVEKLGGKTDGILRFSIMWAEEGEDNSDLDAWCETPKKTRIGFSNKLDKITGGNLDVDITHPEDHHFKDIVENITFPKEKKLVEGTYIFYIHQYAARDSQGFKAEISFNGETYFYEYKGHVSGMNEIARVTYRNGNFSIKHTYSPSNETSSDIYGLSTQQFHKANLICLSPNYWDSNKVGNKHYFFMLEGCKTQEDTRSFHNENLIPELLKHRKVMEVLGFKTMLTPTDNQLSGLGFNSTVKDEVIVKLSGNFKRMLKIKF